MKNFILIPLLSLLTLTTHAQDFDKNGCTQALAITFLKKGEAEEASKNHVLAQGHLNLMLRKSRIWHRNKSINNKSDFSQAILRDSTLSGKFDVIIGIDNRTRFELLSNIICWLQDFRLGYLQYSNRIDKVAIYHFDD